MMRHRKVNVLVVGDVMLDRFVYGTARRLSPEAPVPVLSLTDEKAMLGGAGNVVRNIISLGADAELVSVIGDDSSGRMVKELLRQEPCKSRLFVDEGRSTTVKTRCIAGTSHLLRVDSESVLSIGQPMRNAVLSAFEKRVEKSDIVLISDYGKGLLPKELCQEIIRRATSAGRRIIVDPKGCDYSKYSGVTIVKPNLKEFCEVTAQKLDPAEPGFVQCLMKAARRLCARFGLGGVLVTLSEHGMIYVPRGKDAAVHIPTEARSVYDVSGAGDTSLAALGIALAEGKTVDEAMRFANSAAGVAVSKLGTAIVSREEIESASRMAGGFDRKILSRKQLVQKVAALKRAGMRIGFTNGCFDCCHRGHLKSLRDARALCDVLVVGVNSDAWITAHKGKNRPIQDEMTRAELLASLSFVDFVVIFGEETALPLVRALRPHLIAKEGYALADWPEGRFVKSSGGEAVVLERVEGCSTTALVEKMNVLRRRRRYEEGGVPGSRRDD